MQSLKQSHLCLPPVVQFLQAVVGLDRQAGEQNAIPDAESPVPAPGIRNSPGN